MKENEEIYVSNIVIEDTKIVYIGEDYETFSPFDNTIDICGNVIMPSFKNLHGHAPMVFARALTDGVSLEGWLNKIIFPLESHLTKDMIYSFTKLAILEYLSSGISISSEMYYYPEEMAKAAIEYHYPLHLVCCNKEYKNTIKTIEKAQKKYAKPLPITYTVGLHSVYTIDDTDLNNAKEYLLDHKEGLCVHACETSKEVENCRENHNGLTPIEYLDSLGLFTYGGTVYHANWLSDNDYKIIKEKHIIPVTCAGSNTKLASGICAVRELLDQGIKVAIGTDGAASNDSLDMFNEMKQIVALQKIKHMDASIIKPFEVLEMTTVNGAIALGLDESLYVEVGQTADLIEIDLLKPSMQPINDIVSNIVFSGSKDIIKMTIVRGQILYRENKFLVNDDIEKLYKKCQKLADELKKFRNI